MRTYVKNLMIRALSGGGVHPTPMTRPARVQELIRSLRPVETAAPLVRLGPAGDGGYLVPDDLEGIEACFSPGVSVVSGFEKDCAERGMEVFMADASVDKPTEWHERFHFVKKYVGVTTSDRFMTIDDWVKSSLPASTSDLLLQIDIEGFEYETFLGMSDALLRRFRVIVAEFHDMDMLWSRPFFDVASRAFEKILQTHACVHVHPNNCCGSVRKGGIEIPLLSELTFLRRDRVSGAAPATRFPHPLDRDNTPSAPLPLPRGWYE